MGTGESRLAKIDGELHKLCSISLRNTSKTNESVDSRRLSLYNPRSELTG
ncbi:hypothetical protein VIBNIAM115_1870068 [Vibrio nigripulchritudo AM115]|nr:hypothetical protein VIBNIAM115_1870068 [Vibrio nigripulchritudo AM115]